MSQWEWKRKKNQGKIWQKKVCDRRHRAWEGFNPPLLSLKLKGSWAKKCGRPLEAGVISVDNQQGNWNFISTVPWNWILPTTLLSLEEELVFSEECSSAKTSISAQLDLCQTYGPHNCEIINGYCFKLRSLWFFTTTVIGNENTRYCGLSGSYSFNVIMLPLPQLCDNPNCSCTFPNARCCWGWG